MAAPLATAASAGREQARLAAMARPAAGARMRGLVFMVTLLDMEDASTASFTLSMHATGGDVAGFV
ncbi:hypothetical protein GCM10027030_14360 [Luteococcus sediminum]